MASPKNAKKHNNKGFSLCVPVGSPLWQIQKDAKKHDNNVASAHCVNNSEGRKIVKAYNGLKPVVIKKFNEFMNMDYFGKPRNDE